MRIFIFWRDSLDCEPPVSFLLYNCPKCSLQFHIHRVFVLLRWFAPPPSPLLLTGLLLSCATSRCTAVERWNANPSSFLHLFVHCDPKTKMTLWSAIYCVFSNSNSSRIYSQRRRSIRWVGTIREELKNLEDISLQAATWLHISPAANQT